MGYDIPNDHHGRNVTISFPLTFEEVTSVNSLRCQRWHNGFPAPEGSDGWSGGDWGNALAGEVGEACNVIKKLRRLETGAATRGDQQHVELVVQLGEELADIFIYLDLVATYYGINLPSEVVAKFNEVSAQFGWPEKLRTNI